MSTTPGANRGLPITATSSPRFSLSSSDSWGDSIDGVISDAVCTGFAGSAMSSTVTPVRSALRNCALLGKSSVLS